MGRDQYFGSSPGLSDGQHQYFGSSPGLSDGPGWPLLI